MIKIVYDLFDKTHYNVAFRISQVLNYLQTKFLKNSYVKHKEGYLYHLLLYRALIPYINGGVFAVAYLM